MHMHTPTPTLTATSTPTPTPMHIPAALAEPPQGQGWSLHGRQAWSSRALAVVLMLCSAPGASWCRDVTQLQQQQQRCHKKEGACGQVSKQQAIVEAQNTPSSSRVRARVDGGRVSRRQDEDGTRLVEKIKHDQTRSTLSQARQR